MSEWLDEPFADRLAEYSNWFAADWFRTVYSILVNVILQANQAIDCISIPAVLGISDLDMFVIILQFYRNIVETSDQLKGITESSCRFESLSNWVFFLNIMDLNLNCNRHCYRSLFVCAWAARWCRACSIRPAATQNIPHPRHELSVIPFRRSELVIQRYFFVMKQDPGFFQNIFLVAFQKSVLQSQ